MAVTIGERHIGVHFQHHNPRLGNGGHRVVGSQCQREKAVLIHRRSHGKHHVGRNQVAIDQYRQFGKIGRDIVDPAFKPAWPRSAAEKIGGVANICLGFLIEISVLANRQNLRNLNIAKIAPRLGERSQ